MAEHVNSLDLFGTGGHVWLWGEQAQAAKQLSTVGVRGAARIVLVNGPRPLRIAGRAGGPAVLKAADTTRPDADAAMDVLEEQIEALRMAGTKCTWEDDQGHTGASLVITRYTRSGGRLYGRDGTDWIVWQRYTVEAVELLGEPAP